MAASFPEIVLTSKMGPFGLAEVPNVRIQRRIDRKMETMGRMRGSLLAPAAALLLAGAVACGGKPSELVPPVGKAAVIDETAAFSKIRFADGLPSANERCPVTKRKLSAAFPPIYVNGLPIGFC
jgi:hypothetical protein